MFGKLVASDHNFTFLQKTHNKIVWQISINNRNFLPWSVKYISLKVEKVYHLKETKQKTN